MIDFKIYYHNIINRVQPAHRQPSPFAKREIAASIIYKPILQEDRTDVD